MRVTVKGQSWVHLQFFAILGDFCPNQPMFDQLLVYICLERRYNLFSSLHCNWPDHIQTEKTNFALSGPNFCRFRGIWARAIQRLNSSHFCAILIPQNVSLKSPKFYTSRKISVFSFKEIDRSLLLEDFLRKSEIVYSGDF